MGKIIGYQSVEFEKNGFSCVGTNFYLVCDDGKKGLVGNSTDKIYVSEKVLASSGVSLDKSVIGKTLRVYYNRYGRPESILIQ